MDAPERNCSTTSRALYRLLLLWPSLLQLHVVLEPPDVLLQSSTSTFSKSLGIPTSQSSVRLSDAGNSRWRYDR
jgi:hypothetical protein